MTCIVRHYINREALANTVKWVTESDNDHWHMGIYLINKTAINWYPTSGHVNVCNTAGCIAGHIVMGHKGGGLKGVLEGNHFVGVLDQATAYLQCSYQVSRALFEPVTQGLSLISREAALDLLTHMLEDEILDWPRVLSTIPYSRGWVYKNGADQRMFLTFE